MLNGAKTFTTNAHYADVCVAMAVTDRAAAQHGISAFIADRGTPGFRAGKKENKLGLRASDTAELIFEDCFLPAENLLGHEGNGFIDAMRVLDGGRISIAALSLGMAEGAYEAALNYSKERKQFGKPIAGFQLVQDLLVRMLGNVTACQAMMLRLAQLQDQGLMEDEHASLAKAYTTVKCRETVGYARELLGGNGILLENHVGRFVADAEAIYSYEGTREMNTLIVGKAITGLSAFI